MIFQSFWQKKKTPIYILNVSIEKVPNISPYIINGCLSSRVKNLAELRQLIENNDSRLSVFGARSRQKINQIFANMNITLPKGWEKR